MEIRYCIVGKRNEETTDGSVVSRSYIFDQDGNLVPDSMIHVPSMYFETQAYANKKLKTFVSTYKNIVRYGNSGSYLPDIFKLNIDNGKLTGLVCDGDSKISSESMMVSIQPISGFKT